MSQHPNRPPDPRRSPASSPRRCPFPPGPPPHEPSAAVDTQTTHRRSPRSEEHTSQLQSPCNLVCRLLLEKKKKKKYYIKTQKTRKLYTQTHSHRINKLTTAHT